VVKKYEITGKRNDRRKKTLRLSQREAQGQFAYYRLYLRIECCVHIALKALKNLCESDEEAVSQESCLRSSSKRRKSPTSDFLLSLRLFE
jgi:hypothetical protein